MAETLDRVESQNAVTTAAAQQASNEVKAVIELEALRVDFGRRTIRSRHSTSGETDQNADRLHA
jgi:hypothetical protein